MLSSNKLCSEHIITCFSCFENIKSPEFFIKNTDEGFSKEIIAIFQVPINFFSTTLFKAYLASAPESISIPINLAINCESVSASAPMMFFNCFYRSSWLAINPLWNNAILFLSAQARRYGLLHRQGQLRWRFVSLG
mgnify:CR=1 FL=1